MLDYIAPCYHYYCYYYYYWYCYCYYYYYHSCYHYYYYYYHYGRKEYQGPGRSVQALCLASLQAM